MIISLVARDFCWFPGLTLLSTVNVKLSNPPPPSSVFVERRDLSTFRMRTMTDLATQPSPPQSVPLYFSTPNDPHLHSPTRKSPGARAEFFSIVQREPT